MRVSTSDSFYCRSCYNIVVAMPHIVCEETKMALSQNTDVLQTTFHELADAWRRGTGYMSSVQDMAMHPAYQRIIGLGQPAIALILEELQARPNHWFWALRAITGDNPVPENHVGNVKLMAQDWLSWGKERGYI